MQQAKASPQFQALMQQRQAAIPNFGPLPSRAQAMGDALLRIKTGGY
jgi:hypothetical protein